MAILMIITAYEMMTICRYAHGHAKKRAYCPMRSKFPQLCLFIIVTYHQMLLFSVARCGVADF